MLEHTRHSAYRSAQRGLTNDEIEYVHHYGTLFHKEGALIVYLREQDIPLTDRNLDWASHLEGTALVIAKDGRLLLTAWRNRRSGLKLIRKKPTHPFGLDKYRN
jgi:hypothetical protein